MKRSSEDDEVVEWYQTYYDPEFRKLEERLEGTKTKICQYFTGLKDDEPFPESLTQAIIRYNPICLSQVLNGAVGATLCRNEAEV